MRVLLFLLTILFLVSCATPYQSSGLTGGYSETWENERIVEVTFKGNGFISSEKSAKYAAFRACELTLENGYTHFVILNSNESIQKMDAKITNDRVNITGNDTYGYTATYREGQTMTVFKPTNKMRVFFMKEDELDIAYEHGITPISAVFYLEKNASDGIRDKIIN